MTGYLRLLGLVAAASLASVAAQAESVRIGFNVPLTAFRVGLLDRQLGAG